MAVDRDALRQSKAIESVANELRQINRVLDTINTNLVAVGRLLQEKENQDATER